LKARDIMEPVSDVLTPDTTIREAVERMRMTVRTEKKGYIGVKAMIVVDRPRHPVGILSMKDILREIIPWYLEEGKIGGFTWEGMLEALARKVATRPVGDIMAKTLITVEEDAPLMECAELLVKHNLQRLPVLNRDGELAGIVYLRDLYHAVARAFTGEVE